MDEKELQLILESGEGYKIEFKESVTGIDKDMVAFANSAGGRIFIGITDDGEIKGVKITNKLKSQVQDIANNCQPPVNILMEEFRNILIVEVREGEDKPYKCSSGFYIRVGPNSQKLSRNEIIEFFKSEGKIRFDELFNLKFDYRKHFDRKKFEKFLKLAGISKVLSIPSILINLGVAEKQEGKLIFNNAGILFFARNLNDIYFHTVVTCALYKGTEKVNVLDGKDYNEDIVSNVDMAMNFLKNYIPVKYEITGEPRRKEIPEIPYEALREAVINAVVHRDYFEKGANVMVEIFDDRIEISNPGGLVKGLKPKDFGKKSVLRNPHIASLFHRIGYIEKMGTGINRMRKLLREAGLPEPEFEFDTFFTVTFRRPYQIHEQAETLSDTEIEVKFKKLLHHEGVIEGVNDAVRKRLLREIVYLKKKGYLRRPQVEAFFGISKATAERDLSLLKSLGLIEFVGPPKTGKYVLTEKGKKLWEE